MNSWSLVKMGTTAAHKKLFFNLRKLKNEMKAIDDGDLLPEQVSQIAERLNVSEKEAVSMTRRMAKHDSSLNAPVREEGEGEWLDWLTDDQVSQEDQMARSEELDNRRILLAHAMERLDGAGTSYPGGTPFEGLAGDVGNPQPEIRDLAGARSSDRSARL